MAVLMSKLHSICQLNKVQAKQLASVVGSIISMSLAVGLVSQFMTRCLYSVLETRHSWWILQRMLAKSWNFGRPV